MRIKTLAVSAALVAAAGLASAAQAQNVRGVSKNEVVIGQHTDLSGPAASYGVNVSNAMRLYFDKINADGGVHGRRIRLIVEDHQYQVPRAVQAANKLINRDKIFLMLLSIGTPMNNAILPDQIKAGVPNMFPLTAARQMYEPFHPLKWSATTSYYGQIRSAVKYFVSAKGRRNVCSLHQDTDFGREILDGTKDQLAAMNMKLVETATHKPADTDFTAQITKLRAANCDLVTLGSIVRDSILPIATAKKMGWNVDMVGTTAAFDLNVSGAPGGVTEGLYAMTQIEAPYRDTGSAAVQQWMDRYKAKYGTDPNPSSQLSYVAADLVVMGLDRAGKDLTVEKFIKAMESIQGYKDIFGGPVMTFGPDRRNGTDAAFLAQVKSGRWVRSGEQLTN